MSIEIVPREQWGARPARRTSRIPLPSRELWLHHTVGGYYGPSGMRRLQAFHQDDRNFRDVGYSLVVDGRSLTIYEGAGIGILGAHTKGHNSIGHGIAVTGNFNNVPVTAELVNLLAELVAHGHQRGWWPKQLTGGHRDVKATSCPGNHLYNAIPTINRIAETKEPDMDYPTDDIKTIQTRLQALGYDIGPSGADGILGPKTMGAYNAAMTDYELVKPGSGEVVGKAALLDRFAEAVKATEDSEKALEGTRSDIRGLYGL